MMKISDPIIFGHCVSVFFAPLVEKFGAALDAARSQTRTRAPLCWLLARLLLAAPMC